MQIDFKFAVWSQLNISPSLSLLSPVSRYLTLIHHHNFFLSHRPCNLVLLSSNHYHTAFSSHSKHAWCFSNRFFLQVFLSRPGIHSRLIVSVHSVSVVEFAFGSVLWFHPSLFSINKPASVRQANRLLRWSCIISTLSSLFLCSSNFYSFFFVLFLFWCSIALFSSVSFHQCWRQSLSQSFIPFDALWISLCALFYIPWSCVGLSPGGCCSV